MSVIDLKKLKDKDEEIISPAIAVYIEKACPKCKLGRMNFAGKVIPGTNGARRALGHECDKCHHRAFYQSQYPRVEFKKVETETNPEEVKH
jgi:hypothetical protein